MYCIKCWNLFTKILISTFHIRIYIQKEYLYTAKNQ